MLSSATRALFRTGATQPLRSYSNQAPKPSKEQLQHALLNHPATEVTTLSNGVRVASQPGPGTTATVGVWVDAGSRYETKQNNGVAHFAEHMFFKGTPTRSRVKLEEEVENLGAQLNAYTSREQTVFYMECFDKDVPHSLGLLADILQNSKMTESAIEAERDLILREMEEVNSKEEEVIFDHLHEIAYEGTSLGQNILGPAENVRSITRDDIQNYLQTHYTAGNMVIAGAGAIDHAVLVKEAEKLFSSIPRDPMNGIKPYMEPARFVGGDRNTRIDDMEEVHIAMGFPIAGATDPDHYPLLVLQSMLGNWSRSSTAGTGQYASSELVRESAEDPACNSVTVFKTPYADTGMFGVYGVCHPTGLHALQHRIMSSLISHSYEVSDIELQQGKNALAMMMLQHLDGSNAICEDIGRSMLSYGRHIHPLEALERIEAVDANAIKNAARRYFQDRDFACAVIGPTVEYCEYTMMRHSSYWRM